MLDICNSNLQFTTSVCIIIVTSQIESTQLMPSIINKELMESEDFIRDRDLCTKYFENWCEGQQVIFVEHLLSRMCHYQHGQINSFLKPMLQRDFISALPGKCWPQWLLVRFFVIYLIFFINTWELLKYRGSWPNVTTLYVSQVFMQVRFTTHKKIHQAYKCCTKEQC